MKFLFFAFVLMFAGPAFADDVVYLKPTLSNLSKMYWSLGKFDVDDRKAVDNFMRINECDIFRDYYFNEFEWRGIRKSTQEYLESSKDSFGRHFEFVQPLALGEYDFDRRGFAVLDDFSLDAVRRLKILADDFQAPICGVDGGSGLSGYPTLIAVELNRPLTLDFIPVEEEVARFVVENKLQRFRNLSERAQNRENLFQLRDAVFVMKLRFFALDGEDVRIMQQGTAVPLLAILESVEVYSDRGRQELLYSLDYRRERSESSLEQKMRAQYEKLKKAQEEKAAE